MEKIREDKNKLAHLMAIDYIVKPSDRDDELKQSFDGGLTWGRVAIYNELHIIIRHKINQHLVKIMAPKLAPNEMLCPMCANDAQVGIARSSIEYGLETQTVIRFDGDCEYTTDESFGVSYRVWRCTRCGQIAESDYA